MKGRKPTPSHLKLVKGNPGRRPMNAAEPKPERSRPSPPAHMTDKGRETWGYVSGLLDRMGILTEVDAVGLELLCEAYADLLKARDELDAFGSDYYETVNQSGGVMHRAHPAVAVRNDAERRIKAWLAEFGMTPSARSRVRVNGEEAEQEDKAAQYF